MGKNDLNPLSRFAGRLFAFTRRLHDAQHALPNERHGQHECREALARERDRLQQRLDVLISERLALEPILVARDESRLIITDYPYHPAARPLQTSAAGKRLAHRLSAGQDGYTALLQSFACHLDRLAQIPRDASAVDPLGPHWRNDWIPALDAVSIYGMLAHFQPRRYVEVGSGNTTRFARRAIRDLGLRTKIISIDPMPRVEVEAICDQIVRAPLESVNQAFWKEFSSEDILFVDNSHRSFMNSDVTVFFTDILPMLPPGSIWGLHDICLPEDYPNDWRDRYYNEQYLLLAYLDGGSVDDEILLPLAWVSSQPQIHGILTSLWQRRDLMQDVGCHGAGFWMRRKPERSGSMSGC